MATCIRRLTNVIGAPHGPSVHNCSEIWMAQNFKKCRPQRGAAWPLVPARGAAFGDIFNDGHIDVVLNNMDSAPALLRNVVKNGNHWIAFKLVGAAKSPRDAIGAAVFVTTRGVRQRGDVLSGGSYGSSSDPRVHFGLGSASKIERVEIRWPDGKKEDLAISGVDRIVTVREGQGIVAK